ncbi:hypothetical protein EG328_004982 [Venturia inaequalis]|uniref:Uncharacterized protein n=1 Tax=Venturia inaequalis TaxID=5025 RepID=A0A8H3UKS4_VENIN|nr:hypothetical protein EG328_004982 [Venturia inaequalis]KAE9991184.1 hypothetical protein EG327_000366 [Venturia inaequalis]RDI77522.1 hypothetical protein Vi05172_g12525 [Venturia inaequalis]
MTTSPLLPKLFAILFFTSFFFSLFVQNAAATPITTSNNLLTSPETLYKRTEAGFFDGPDDKDENPARKFLGFIHKVFPGPRGGRRQGPGRKKTKNRKKHDTDYPDQAECDEEVSTKGKPVVFSTNFNDKLIPSVFAKTVGGVTLSDTVSAGFMRKNPKVKDPRGQVYDDFLERLGLALAKKSSGTVYVVDAKIETSNKVWKKFQEPALHANPRVTKLIRVNSVNFADRTVLWEKH